MRDSSRQSKLVPSAVKPITRMKKKTGKDAVTWSEAWFVSAIRGAIREIWFRWPARNQVFESVAVEVPRYKKDGTLYKKGTKMAPCALCLELCKKALTPKQKARKKAWTKEKAAAKKAGMPLPDRPDDLPRLAVIDHKQALVPVDGRYQDWHEYIMESFVDPLTGLHVLCDECHGQKSQEENAMRRSVKNDKGVE